MEIYKDIKGYEGLYQVSNLGNVKSLKYGKEKILKAGLNGRGYYNVVLCSEGVCKTKQVHQLVSIAFLNHTPNGFKTVVDHINHIKTDNRVENLRLVSARANTSHRKKKGSSIYTGVYWDKATQKWVSQIQINGKRKHLGSFNCEIEASEAYKTALNNLNK